MISSPGSVESLFEAEYLCRKPYAVGETGMPNGAVDSEWSVVSREWRSWLNSLLN